MYHTTPRRGLSTDFTGKSSQRTYPYFAQDLLFQEGPFAGGKSRSIASFCWPGRLPPASGPVKLFRRPRIIFGAFSRQSPYGGKPPALPEIPLPGSCCGGSPRIHPPALRRLAAGYMRGRRTSGFFAQFSPFYKGETQRKLGYYHEKQKSIDSIPAI